LRWTTGGANANQLNVTLNGRDNQLTSRWVS